MTTLSIDKITTKLVEKYSNFNAISKEEKVNKFLDDFNNQKKDINERSDGLNFLAELLNQITWIDKIEKKDEIIIRLLIDKGRFVDLLARKNYARINRIFHKKGWHKKELLSFKDSIDFHNETLSDLERIIFVVRKNEKFNNLDKLINEL